MTHAIDNFPCILLTSDINTNEILSANAHAYDLLLMEKNELSGLKVQDIFSKATLIFLESYIRTTLMHDGECSELQITLLTKQKQKLPSIANIELKEEILYWAIFSAKQRDKLYQELVESRNRLEEQAEILEQLASIDPLTQLLNRRQASAQIDALVIKSARLFVPLSFLMVDIDYFKKVNDTFGHDQGDKVITRVAKAIKLCCREVDITARWGGEEFLLVLYNSTHDNVQEFSTRLHKTIGSIGKSDIGVTVSIGVSHLLQSDACTNNTNSLIEEADKALYMAKKLGRNRTEYFTQD